jgi:hypothetical protein
LKGKLMAELSLGMLKEELLFKLSWACWRWSSWSSWVGQAEGEAHGRVELDMLKDVLSWVFRRRGSCTIWVGLNVKLIVELSWVCWRLGLTGHAEGGAITNHNKWSHKKPYRKIIT